MAKTFSLNKSSDGQSVVATRQENEIDASYAKYEESHPNPEQNNYNVVMPEPQSAPESAPQTTAKPESQIGTKSTTKPSLSTEIGKVIQMGEPEPAYNYDAHFSQQWFLDEQENRKNPEYVKQGTDIMDDDTFNAIADAIKIRKEANPKQWELGDPGWRTDTTLYQDYIKPMEEKYRQQIHNAQIAEMSKSTYDDVMATTKFNPSKDAGVSEEKGNFSNLQTMGKGVNLFMPGQAGTDIANQPGMAKYTQPIAQAMASSGGVAGIARDVAITAGLPGVGWVYGGVKAADFAYSLTKAYGWHDGNKVYDKIKEWIDIPDEKMQQGLGALNYAFNKVCGGDLADPTKVIENVDSLFKNIDEIWDYAYGSKKASTEYDSDIVGLVMGATANMGATPLIGDFADRFILNVGSSALDDNPNFADYGQTTRYNLGQEGVWDIPEEMLGSKAPEYWLKTVQGWRDEGKVTDIQDLEYLFWNQLNQVYGDKANLSEFTEHEFVDPSNTMENMETRGINLYAKATGDKNLEIASKPGSLIADLTENIPGIGLIRTIGQTVSGNKDFLKTSNGINEVLAAWDLENITNPTDQLTARDRRFSGITEDGTLKRMNPNPDTVLGSGKVGEFIANATNLLRKTDETKASYEGDAIFDYINVMVDDAVRARGDEDVNTTVARLTEFVNELEHPETISTESPFYKNSQSALFNTVKNDVAEAVRTNRKEIMANIDKFRNLENNRNTLYTLSSALNMTPHQFMEKYNNDKVTLAKMIENKANENGGTIPGVKFADGTPIPVDSKEFGTAVLDMVRPFAGNDGQAYDVRQLGLQLTSSLADGISTMLVNKYNIKPEGMMYRFGDMIKKMQSLVLLGLSPSYLANNFINNVATRTALGYGGYLTPNTINNWMNRFGFRPERLQESFTQDYLGVTDTTTASGKLQGQIKQARQKVDGKGIKKGLADFMEKTGDLASKTTDKVGVFSKLSGEIEKSESQQVSVSAMMTYMARTWKPGVNFRKMPIQLESAINSQCPGMADAIYKAVGNGMNMAEIENAIFGTFIAPSVKDTLVEAAKALKFERPEDIVTEYFAKGGMLEQLNKALEGKRGNEIDTIVNDYADYLKKILFVQLSDNTKNKAQSVKQNVKNIGYSEAMDWASDISNDMLEVWLNSQDVNTSLFQKRLRDNMSPREFHALYQEHLKNLNERWQTVYRQSEQVWNGILKGLNIKGRNETQYVNNLQKKNQVWAKFYEKTQPKLFKPYLDAINVRPDDTFGKRENGKYIPGTWDKRVEKAWNTYINAVRTEIQKVYVEEANCQTRMDNAFLAGLKKSLGETKAQEVDSTIATLMQEVNAKRTEMIEQVKVVRDIADNTKNLYEKNNAWYEAEAKLKELKKQYADKQQELYNAVKEIGKDVYDTVADTQKEPADIEAEIQNDVAEEQADKHQKEAEKFAEVMVDAAISGNLSDIDSATPNNWKMEINRKNLRDVAMKAGATKEQADAYARYVGAVARSWERRNPGKDFFKDKLGLSVEYIDEDMTVTGASGLFQMGIWSEDLRNTLASLAKRPSTKDYENISIGKAYGIYLSLISLSFDLEDLLDVQIQDESSGEFIFAYPNKLLSAIKESLTEKEYDQLLETTGDYQSIADRTFGTSGAPVIYSQRADYVRLQLEALIRKIEDGEISRNEARKLFGLIEVKEKLQESIPDNIVFADTNSPRFKIWYGNSPEMFDENGKPVIVYHGSKHNNIVEFDTDKRGKGAGGGDTKQVWYLNSSGIASGNYASAYHDSIPEMAYNALKKSVKSKVDYFNSENLREDYLKGKMTTEFIDLLVNKQARNMVENLDIDGMHKEAINSDLYRKGESLKRSIQANVEYGGINNFESFFNAYDELAYMSTHPEVIDEYQKNFPYEKWYTKAYYVQMHNPLVVDVQGASWGSVPTETGNLQPYINQAIRDGNDGVIVRNIRDGGGVISTDYLVFNSNQIKSIYNDGSYSESNNVYHQSAEQRIKGEFKIQDGEKLVQLFRGSDFSTLVHETMGHGFSTTLERNQQEALAAYNGWTLFRYRQLENQFYNDPDSMDAKDRQDWIDAQERFAYGFEQYLMEGKAPNDGIRSVFEAFRQFLLDIYQGIRKLVYKGEEIDIHKKQNGVTLAQIFDSMLDESQTRGHKWQGTTEFNITGQENFQRGEGESESFGTTINDNNRQFFQSESERQLEKVIKVKQGAENKLRGDVADYVNDLSKKWNLTPEESEELIVETMHRMGLNQNLPEDPVLKHNIELKLGKYDKHQMDKFVKDHMSDAVKIDDKAIDMLLKDNTYYGQGDYSFGYSFGQTDQNSQMAWDARQQKAQEDLRNGKYVPIEYIDLTTIEPSSSRDTEVQQLAGALFNLYNADIQTRREKGEKVPHYEDMTLDDFVMFIYDTKDKLNNRVLDSLKYEQILWFLQMEDQNNVYRDAIESLRTNSAKTDPLTKRRQPIPAKGTYVAQTYSSEYGQYEIVGTVTHDGRIVAYVPSQMPLTEVQIDDDHKVRILGVDVTNPDQLVYLDEGKVKKQKIREDDGTNPYQGEMARDSLGALDPVAEAHNKMAYEQIFEILKEFKELYKQNLNENMMNQNYSKLKAETKADLRSYIDTDVRTDLANAKFKAGKFGNMMRDAALLNYNNRYGFDNALTLLCPYQFWQTRSFLKWISRMGSKGGRMWRRYAKLLKLAQRNQKEYMPSRVSNMFGIYLPFLPEWAGNQAFVSADQFLVVPQFINPILDYFKGNNAVRAVAERNLQEALRDERISYQDYVMAMDPATRDQSSVWQEYYAKAQISEGADKNLADMFGQYFGLSLPLSIYQAVSQNDPSKWNQWPMTRTGTAWRATFGDNFVGNLGQDIMSLPERAIRKAVTSVTGDDSFAYNEFGAFADYYIRQQVWDMVAEGRIGPEDAVQAVVEKGNNKIWNEAADRQREELLMKMQGGMSVDAVRRLISGDGDPVDNWKMLLAGLVTTPVSKQFVREGESIWREQKAEQSEAYDAYYAGDKEALNRFDEKSPNYRYNNLRYEDDPEQSLRKYLHQNIMQNYFKLDKAEKNRLNMSFTDGDFYADVIDKDTRAIESMDLNRLVAYAQALNGKIPNLATDKINLQNIQPINLVDFPQTTIDKVNQYYQEMSTLYPGMDKVEKIYYALEPEYRKAFGKTQPDLYKMWDWKKQYKKDNTDVADFLKLSSASYDIRDAEEVFSYLDDLTTRELKSMARTGGTPDKAFQPLIESAMKKAGITDKYSDYLKDLYKYILGE